MFKGDHTMFKWRRWATSPEFAAHPRPPAAAEKEKEKDKPIPYDLISAQLRILDRNRALTIIDAGAHHGHTTEQYLENFAQSRVIAIEPDRENFAKAAARVAAFGDRVELVRAGLSESEGTADLYRNAYDMTHSLLKLGDMRYYDEPFAALAPEKIETITVDSLCAKRNIEVVDILKMDIQGGELKALQGAKDMLSRGAIRLVVLEVNFVPLYQRHAHVLGYRRPSAWVWLRPAGHLRNASPASPARDTPLGRCDLRRAAAASRVERPPHPGSTRHSIRWAVIHCRPSSSEMPTCRTTPA